LLVFLTPYIIKDQSDIQRIFEQKVRERREFVEAYSAFEERPFETHIDYRRKRGLVEEIDKAVQTSDEDDRLLEESKHPRRHHGEEGEPDRTPPPAPGATPQAPEGAHPPPREPEPEPQPPPQPQPQQPPGE